MRVLLAPFGSRGDVQPMLALGLALRSRGHSVVVCAPPDHVARAAALGLTAHPVGPSMSEFVERSMASARYAMKALPAMIAEQFMALEPFAAACDVMLGATLTACGPSFAQVHGVRYRYVTFSPAAMPSAEHPSLFTKSQGLPRWLNRLTWWLSGVANNVGLRGVINTERKRLGLPSIADAWSHLLTPSPIVASDPALAPTPGYEQTGAWFLPETDELSPELEGYLAAGEPPVYVGFGSMPKPAVRVLETLKGRRAIVSGMPAREGQLRIESAPHGKLSPRCSLVIHHGGAGTTVTAARAGVPQQIVPHATDQFFWRKRVEELGLGDAAAARAFAQQVVSDGVERAVAIIERR